MIHFFRQVKGLIQRQGVLHLIRKVIFLLRSEGYRGISWRISRLLVKAEGREDVMNWQRLYHRPGVAECAALALESEGWPRRPLISVLMPVYNPPEIWLRRAIESVIGQTYVNWELCIADDASPQTHVRKVLEEYRRRDARIKVVFRPENGHISAASNSALKLAGGEFAALLDHDDELAPHALYYVAKTLIRYPDAALIYSDEDKVNERGLHTDPYFKPDWNPDLFLSQNMVSHLGAYRTALLREIGGFRLGYEGSQDYDLALRVVERVDARQIHHIPRVLYHWRALEGSTALDGGEKPYASDAALKAIEGFLARSGVAATVQKYDNDGVYRVRYKLPEPHPLVSIIIPTRNGLALLRQCIESIHDCTDYRDFEIIVVDNGSDDPAALEYLHQLESVGKVRILRDDGAFNFSALNNKASKIAKGELLCLLNNDIEVISRDWLGEMVSHALRPGIGAVGARLWYPDYTLQHGGVILVGGVAGHAHKYFPRNNPGYFRRAVVIQNFSAVTAACLVLRKKVFDEVGGLDEGLALAFNDVDFCLRIRARGYRNLWTPYAELFHHESASRGTEDTPEKIARFQREMAFMKQRWGNLLQNDPAYNPNLTLDAENFSLAFPPPDLTEDGLRPGDANPGEAFSKPDAKHLDGDNTVWHRKVGYSLLHGKGLEIGAFNSPARLAQDCTVIYADVRDREESLPLYPEIAQEDLATVDVVVDLDKSGLSCFRSGEFDFVILNQVVAQLANPIHAIGEVFRVLKPGGMAVISTHDKTYSFDKRRPSTTFEHLLEEYRQGVDFVADDHYETFLHTTHPKLFRFDVEEISQADEKKIADAMASVRARCENAHTWDSARFRIFLERAMGLLEIRALCRYESVGQENKLEYFSVWQKYDSQDDLIRIVANSWRRIEHLNHLLRKSEQQVELLHSDLQARERELRAQENQIRQMMHSRSWRITAPLRSLGDGLRFVRQLMQPAAAHRMREHGDSAELPPVEPVKADSWELLPLVRNYNIQPHQSSVEIVVCVHNALEDVELCLSSIIRHTLPPYGLILVDDGSAEPARDYLLRFAADQGARLIRNDAARGYTFAANQGLHVSSADYIVLLNSDTLVTPDWLDRMVMCAESDSAIGIVGPLSNTASWQSVPLIEENGDWAANPLPPGVTVNQMATWIACRSARLYPRIPFLNGFCLMVKRAAIENIGYFDEEIFGRGYGEENDYCLRARKAGWELAIADDTYVYHAQSRSYSHERRKTLSDLAGTALADKHGAEIIIKGVHDCREDRVLQGLRARAGMLLERQALIDLGHENWEGRRVLFVMPVSAVGGGANVVISEARAMIAMGVDARILNLRQHLEMFEDSYPGLDVPVIYADREKDVASISSQFDAVVATANQTVRWLKPLAQTGNKPVLGYYIQDFEPCFYAEDTDEYRIALESYTAIPGMVHITKTEWNRAEVQKVTGADCAVIGPSYEVDLFMPRRGRNVARPSAPLRICAMVRPSTKRRAPLLTMRVLRMIEHAYAQQVEIVIFGVEPDDPNFLTLPRDFTFVNLGERNPLQIAALLNEMDIFVDFSTYQAMGLTAMEAMSCGVAVIVPQAGGAQSFAMDGESTLTIDTASEDNCYKSLERLVVDHELRQRLRSHAAADIVRFYPEKAALGMLQALFEGGAEK